jgi:hypothetical protein
VSISGFFRAFSVPEPLRAECGEDKQGSLPFSAEKAGNNQRPEGSHSLSSFLNTSLRISISISYTLFSEVMHNIIEFRVHSVSSRVKAAWAKTRRNPSRRVISS